MKKMKEEISKVLTMLQEGKLTSEDAASLLDGLKEKEAVPFAPLFTPAKSVGAYLDKTLKIRVVSTEGDNINVNLPIKLVKAVLKTGHLVASKIPEAAKYVKDIDFDLIIEAIEQELDGNIVDIKSANGDIVKVVIE